MRKELYLIYVLFLVSCNGGCWLARVVELGDDFALVESDERWIEIFYSYGQNERCFDGRNSVCVVPAKVIAYNSDDRWIIAKSHSASTKTDSYYIIDKEYDFTRLGYEEELKRLTIGPLDSIQFQKEKLRYGIKLELKDSNKLK